MKYTITAALLLSLAAPAALADTKTVSVEGEAAIVEGDAAQTEKDAKRDARRKAVEQGAGVLRAAAVHRRQSGGVLFADVADEV